jgi:ribulose-5-phosphate 4-epimerase/fuculose-1-phosphate aldolase
MREEESLRDEICRVGASLFQRGYTVGAAGNISARLVDGWLITPTDACLGRLEPASISKVTLDGAWVSGDRPSKTLALHRAVYEAGPEHCAVVHTHSTNLVALTLQGVWRLDEVLPPLTPYQVIKVGRVPLIPYARPGAPETAQQVGSFASTRRAVLLERLGPVSWARTPLDAACILEELEETAKLWLGQSPRPLPLEEPAMEELRAASGAHW